MSKINPKDIGITKALAESWQLVSGLKLPIFYISALLSGFWVMGLVLQTALLFTGHGDLIYLWKIPAFIIIWYMMAILIVLGVRRAIGLPVTIRAAFSDCMRVKEKLLGLGLIVAGFMLIFLGFIYLAKSILASAPLLFWLVAIAGFLIYFLSILSLYIFALPLIVTKRCSLKKALQSAYLAIKRHWFSVLVLFIIINIIMFIGMLPLGVGLIWTFPMYAALCGIVFRDVYKLKKKA